MFGNKTKVESFAALKDKPAQEITAEEIAAVNTELSAIGLSGVEVSVAGALETANNNVANLTKELETANASLATANESVSDLTAKLEASNKKVEELNAKLASTPAANAKEITVEKDKIETAVDVNQEDIEMSNSIRQKHGL
jgi:chromosome segregation ATPase